MWTLTVWTFIGTALVIALAYALHRWVGVRRRVMGDEFTDATDSFWAWLWVRAKARWDVTVAAVIAIAPVAWSAGLDIIVIAADLLATVIPGMAGLDLSNLMIPPEIRTYIQIGAIAMPPLRDAIEKLRGR